MSYNKTCLRNNVVIDSTKAKLDLCEKSTSGMASNEAATWGIMTERGGRENAPCQGKRRGTKTRLGC